MCFYEATYWLRDCLADLVSGIRLGYIKWVIHPRMVDSLEGVINMVDDVLQVLVLDTIPGHSWIR